MRSKARDGDKTAAGLWRRCWSNSGESSYDESSQPSKAASSTSTRSPRRAEREKIRRICRRLVGYDPISRGVRASALDVWNRVYRDEYGAVPEDVEQT